MITFTVYGNPVPKARPRMAKTGRVYTPATTKQAEFLIQQVWMHHKDRKKMKGPIALTVSFLLERAKSNKKPHHTQKPDLDNLVKTVLDSLNGLAFDDDSQVIRIEAQKYFAAPSLGEKPSTVITLQEVE